MVKNLANVCDVSRNNNIWHCRLGHTEEKGLFNLNKFNMVEDLNVNFIKRNDMDISMPCLCSV